MQRFYCNSCAVQLSLFPPNNSGQTTRSSGSHPKCFVTDCKHMICQTCRNKCQEKCPVCAKGCRLMELNNNTPYHIRILFEPPQTVYNLFKMAGQFQIKQCEIRTKQLRKEEIRYNEINATDRQEGTLFQQRYAFEIQRQKKLIVLRKKVTEYSVARQQTPVQPHMQYTRSQQRRQTGSWNTPSVFSFGTYNQFKPLATSTPYSILDSVYQGK